ncbi:MAG: energy-coupling factor transporter transmembrane protein EcfT [Treponema sp.]|jgi:biotin transport system permease protein|nr:energy-coupling factor transporter transmembrane protein EcfT [Treponema sp.]
MRTGFEYRPGRGPLHRCPALAKLLGVVALSIFAYGSVPGLLAAALLIAAAALAEGIRPWELLRGSRPVLVLALFFLALRALDFDPARAPFFRVNAAGIPGGLTQGLSMAVSFSGGALLFAVTTTGELRDSLGRGSRFGLAFSLALGFLPRFFEIWEAAGLAWRARGGRKSAVRMIALIPPIAERMLETAFDTAEALEARGLAVSRAARAESQQAG